MRDQYVGNTNTSYRRGYRIYVYAIDRYRRIEREIDGDIRCCALATVERFNLMKDTKESRNNRIFLSQ